MQQSLPEQILLSASSRQNETALVCGKNTLTYKQLMCSAHEIALKLGSFELSKEHCVGIYIEKSFKAVEAILGTLFANCAYVPLDVKSPESQVSYIINDCQLSTFITDIRSLDSLTAFLTERHETAQIIVITDSDCDEAIDNHTDGLITTLSCSCQEADEVEIALSSGWPQPEQLASVLYTSGSTGAPKGVMIEHNALLVFTEWARTYFDVSNDDCFASHAPLNFDLSLFDLFTCFSAGSKLVLIPDNMAGNPRYICQQLLNNKVSIWQSVPSALTLLVKYGNLDKFEFPNLRQVLFAGEKMPAGTLKSLLQHFNSAVFHNVYGATETNDTFVYSFGPCSMKIPTELPIGQPLPFVDYEILDHSKNPVTTVNTEGNLYVKSKTMMRGYRHEFNFSDRTESFYATNDIVKRLSDGNLVFCGRSDDIVKTNGYRVNLLEIENVLKGHPKLKEIAVFAVPSEHMGNKIVAAVSHNQTDEINTLTLKDFCADKLPKYAIPHTFNITEGGLPKTSSGKLNKQALKN